MKFTYWVPSAALAILLTTGCGKKSADVAKQMSELERRANEATARQQELERQIEEQKLAAERDAIERERMDIENAREELARRQDEAAAAEAEKLRQRENDLASRSGKLDMLQSTLDDKQKDLEQKDQNLSERDRELAGREALVSDDVETERNNTPTGDYGTFHETLTPYGSWFETGDYGYVWQPVIVRDVSWRPYMRGSWVCSDRGWTWVSEEPFGWITYHYGRWAYCHQVGWVWVPGSEWAPAWVSWRSSGTHIGWAPLPPETLAYRGGRCDSSVDTTFGIGAFWFNFVETRYFGSPIHHHCLPYTQNNVYINNTVNITNIYVNNNHVICGGPRYWDVQRQTERKPPFYRIEEDRHGRPGRDAYGLRSMVHGDRLRVAAPNVDVAWNDGLKPGKIKGRIEALRVERQEQIKPEVADRFRRDREDKRARAEQSITELGGADRFQLGRMEQLEKNRRSEEARSQATMDLNRIRDGGRQGQIPNRKEGTWFTPPQPGNREVAKDNASPMRQRENETRQDATVTPNHGTRILPQRRSEEQNSNNTVDRLRKQQEQIAEQARQRQDAAQRQQQADAVERNRTQQENDTVVRRQQQQEESRRTQEREQARQQQQMEAQRTQEREQARQQQQEEARREQQREQARQQQMDEARREQQREQARQQQMEEARREQQREQARQQQMEESRREQQREQARQQQMEESRREQQREQARQQQQEESRREQQREQARQQQEQSRRQQEESQRQQQERSRQDQQRQEEDRRGRNR